MLALLLRIGSALFLGTAALLAALTAQARSDTDLNTFVNNCATPCLMGLYPGVTGMNQAIHMLENHPWVARLTRETDSFDGDGELAWLWSVETPPVIDTTYPGHVTILHSVVSSVVIRTNASVGDWQLALGNPPAVLLGGFGRSMHYLFTANDDGTRWQIGGRIDCPLSISAYWNAPGQIALLMEQPFADYPDTSGLVAETDLRALCYYGVK